MKKSPADQDSLVDRQKKEQSQVVHFPRSLRDAYDGYAFMRYKQILQSPRQSQSALQILQHYGLLALWMTVLTVLFVMQRHLWHQTLAATDQIRQPGVEMSRPAQNPIVLGQGQKQQVAAVSQLY